MPLTDLEELRTLVTVIDAGSLSAAARRLNVTVNAVSRRIMRLEGGLGAKLLNRSTRALSLTDEGRRLQVRARRVLDELSAAEDDIARGRETLAGSIRFAMPGSACTVGVLRGIAHLLAENPRLELQIRIVNRQMDVISGGYDVALGIGQPKDSRLVARKLYVSSGWVLAAAPSYLANRKPPRTPADLKRHNCLRFAWASAVQQWQLVDRQGKVSVVEVNGNFEADDSRVLSDAMYAGLGIGLRPDGEVAKAVASGDLVRILPGYRFGAVDVFAIMPKAASRAPRVARFLDAFAEALSREA